MERQNLDRLVLFGGEAFGKRDLVLLAATLAGSVCTRVIHQDVPHELCRGGEAVRAVLPRDVLLARQPQIGFVDQRRSLQGVFRALGPHVLPREAPQLVIDLGHRGRLDVPVPLAQFEQQPTDGLTWVGGR